MILAIVACEIGFWVLLVLGLIARYLLRLPRLGAAFLIAVPLVDLALLVISAIDLRRGGQASMAHGLAAVYLAVTVVFGHRMIRWADQRFAYRFAGGPPPPRRPRAGREHAARERQDWLRHLLAYVLGIAFLGAFTLLAGGPEKALPLWRVMQPWSMVLVVDFLISFSYTLMPRKTAGTR